MSHSRFLPAAAVVLLAVAPAAAQLRLYVAIEKAQVGFKPGLYVNEQGEGQRSVPVAKKGQWAPVSFELKVLRKLDPAKQMQMKLRVEGRDADETRYTAYFPLGQPLIDPNPVPNPADPGDNTRPVNATVFPVELPLRACARPGGSNGEITLTVMTNNRDERSDEISDPVKIDGSQFRDPSVYVVLSLGSKLSGFDLKDDDRGPVQPGQSNRGGLRGGRVETAVLDSVAEMPDHWFAYEAADLVVLPTADSRQGFLEQLFDPQQSQPYTRKREALLEWVRRGGKLLVSVGRDANKLKQYPAFAEMLPVRLGGLGHTEVTKRTVNYTPTSGTGTAIEVKNTVIDPMTKRPKLDQPFWVATLEPKPGRTPLPVSRDAESGALIVAQAPLGLGRVTVVGLDLDAAPFTALDRQFRQPLWDWLIRVAGSERAASVSGADRDRPNYSSGLSPVNVEDGAAAAIRRHIDEFEGVPVISFGWVALFIFLYTLLIGPVEYLFLKKVLGRLELTWVTFPIIVLSVSAAAYFTAYAIKGKDLRINKIDVVDIDLAGKRVYGRTFFTVFSPRVDSYTVGIEPKAPWGAVPQYGTPTPPSMVDWVGGVRMGGGGAGGFRSYRYELDDTGKATSGLVSVPIQVWSTKSFAANWATDFDPANPPVTADLAHLPAAATATAGKITANLPLGNLQEGYAFYAGKAYKLDALPTGVAVPFSSTNATVSGWEEKVTLFDAKFSTDDMYDASGPQRTARGVSGVSAAGPLSLWGVLFGDRAAKHFSRTSQNASLRTLDQSWRLDPKNTEEVVIVAKLARATGPAEQLMTDPASTSPTQLWLRGLPGTGPRVEVPGILQQETYVRIFIPVKPAGAK